MNPGDPLSTTGASLLGGSGPAATTGRFYLNWAGNATAFTLDQYANTSLGGAVITVNGVVNTAAVDDTEEYVLVTANPLSSGAPGHTHDEAVAQRVPAVPMPSTPGRGILISLSGSAYDEALASLFDQPRFGKSSRSFVSAN